MLRSLLILFLAGFSLAAASPQALASPNQEQQLLLDLLNGERMKAGLQKLDWDDHLAQSATAHAALLAEHRTLSHQFPEESELAERIGATGLRFNAAAENVASAPSIEQAHTGLMHSPPHRANILSPNYNAVGFGIIEEGGQFYVAQNFARVLHTYSESEFQNAVATDFNNVRMSRGLPAIDVRADSTVQAAACSDTNDANELIQMLHGATGLELFTAATPDQLPSHMQLDAINARLKHMSIGVCFKPGTEHGYASFKVVAAFYP